MPENIQPPINVNRIHPFSTSAIDAAPFLGQYCMHMNLPRSWIRIADAALAGCCLVAALVLSPDAAGRGLLLLHALTWAALAWKLGLCQALVQILILVALRLPQTAALPPLALLASACGGCAWLLAFWKESRLFALAASLLWALPALLLPSLWPLTLAAYPRLGRLQGESAGLARWPGLLLLAIALGIAVAFNRLPAEFALFTDADAYDAWVTALAALFQREALWLVIPIAGVFEIAQKQPTDLRITWRNLPAAAVIVSALFFPPAAGIAVFYTLALPLCAIMLTRWLLALPDLYARGIVAAALLASALPLLLKGSI
jgi:hypothetical protein